MAAEEPKKWASLKAEVATWIVEHSDASETEATRFLDKMLAKAGLVGWGKQAMFEIQRLVNEMRASQEEAQPAPPPSENVWNPSEHPGIGSIP